MAIFFQENSKISQFTLRKQKKDSQFQLSRKRRKLCQKKHYLSWLKLDKNGFKTTAIIMNEK